MSTGLTLIYMTTKVPNFAHGSILTVGAYIAYTLASFMKVSPYVSAPLAFLIGAGVSLAIYRLVLRPLRKHGSPIVSVMIATLAIDIAFVGVFGTYSDYLANVFRLIGTKSFILISYDFSFFGLQHYGAAIVFPILTLSMVGLLYLGMTRTRFGIAMRASVENPDLASVLGVSVERVYSFSWLLAGGLGAMGGALATLHVAGTPDFGSKLIVAIFAASVLGGFFSIYGAVLGGVIVGGGEVLSVNYLAPVVGSWVTQWIEGVPLIMMAVALLIIPKGLTSIKLRRRR